jgi:hypothetical protein
VKTAEHVLRLQTRDGATLQQVRVNKEAVMSVDRYVKVILTVIAIELGWLAISGSAVPLSAQRATGAAPQPVVIRGIELSSRDVLPVSIAGNSVVPVTLTGNNAVLRVVSERPLQLEQPLIVQNDRPLIVETSSRPLLIQAMPAVPSARPGP